MRTFEQYFHFWFLHFCNCDEPLYVCLDDKQNYISTMEIVKLHVKPVREDLRTVESAFKDAQQRNVT